MAGRHSKNSTNEKLNRTLWRKKIQRNRFLLFIGFICIIIFIYSLFQIYCWLKDSRALEHEMVEINEMVTVTQTAETQEKQEKIQIVE